MNDVIEASEQWRDLGECAKGRPSTKRVSVTIGFWWETTRASRPRASRRAEDRAALMREATSR